MELISVYSKNEGLILSPVEVKDLYLYGVKLKDNQGTSISDETFVTYIKAAQEEIENLLNIRFNKQIIEETCTYYRDEFQAFGFFRASFPVVEPVALDGYLGQIRQIRYPIEWLTSRKTNDGKTYFRNIYIIPNAGTVNTGALLYNGILPYFGLFSYDQVPNYWKTQYVTGFDKIPNDLLGIVGKMAAINILLIAGNLVLGRPGVQSTSLGIDGLSQSVSASNPYKNQIQQYIEDIKNTLSRVQSTYKGVNITSM